VSDTTIAATEVGAYAKKLTANVVETLTFEGDPDSIEIVTDGASAIYYTINGPAPTVRGAGCYELPAFPSARVMVLRRGAPHVVKLISPGTPICSVAAVSQ
jgi:hypothetical protein